MISIKILSLGRSPLEGGEALDFELLAQILVLIRIDLKERWGVKVCKRRMRSFCDGLVGESTSAKRI